MWLCSCAGDSPQDEVNAEKLPKLKPVSAINYAILLSDMLILGYKKKEKEKKKESNLSPFKAAVAIPLFALSVSIPLYFRTF